MEYALLGSTGLAVSRLSFGAMTFGEGALVPGVTNAIGEKLATEMVSRSIDAGINLFDTADMYTSGQSEVLLGKVLGAQRKDVLIATKCGFRSGEALIRRGLSYRNLVQSLESSLTRLGTDYVDVFFLHIPDPWTPAEETLRALEDMTRQGKIRYAGISNFAAWKMQKMVGIQEARGWSRMQVAQMYYSLLGRDIEESCVPFLEDAGLGLMTWSPLASGYLTGKYSGGKDVAGRRKVFDFPPVDTELGDRVVGVLKEIGAEHGATPGVVALAWQLSRPYVTSVIVGATSVGQLNENLRAAQVELTAAQVARLDALTSQAPRYPAWMQPMGADEATSNALGKSV